MGTNQQINKLTFGYCITFQMMKPIFGSNKGITFGLYLWEKKYIEKMKFLDFKIKVNKACITTQIT